MIQCIIDSETCCKFVFIKFYSKKSIYVTYQQCLYYLLFFFTPLHHMNLHEAHQIYFERYLRKKLSEKERAEFEERLITDNDLNEAFKKYRSNRKVYLRELIDDYNTDFVSHTRTNQIIYILLTLILGAVLAFLYFDNQQLRKTIADTYQESTKIIYRSLPFIVKKAELPPPPPEYPVKISDTTISDISENDVLPVETETPVGDDQLEFNTDYKLADSLFQIKESPTDSLSAMHSKKRIKSLQISLWVSPIGFEGYKFDGQSLFIYGLKSFDEFQIRYEKNDIWLSIDVQTYTIINDNNYHKF